MAPSLLIYFLVGIAVAVTVFVGGGNRKAASQFIVLALSIPFWPLFVPMLLAGHSASLGVDLSQQPSTPNTDEMTVEIRRVHSELDAALKSLNGWAEDALARHKDEVLQSHDAWVARSERIREMDRILGSFDDRVPAGFGSEFNKPDEPTEVHDTLTERLRQSQRAIRENISQLRQVRRHAYEELLATLAWVRELASMVHLAKFVGAPQSRVEELLSQIAAAAQGLGELPRHGESSMWQRLLQSPIVEEISELTWKDKSSVASGDNT
jgi:hypothetical protein